MMKKNITISCLAIICQLFLGFHGYSQTIPSNIEILQQPVFTPVCAGEGTSLKVQANGSGLRYQWQVFKRTGNYENLQDTAGYSGSQTSQLNIASVSKSMSQYLYRCKISSGEAVLFSEPAITELQNAIINWQPANGSGYVGDYHSMEVYASGEGLVYQWQANKGSGFANIVDDSTYTGCKTSILSIPHLTKKMDGHQFRCIVSGKACEAVTLTSDQATLTVSTAENPMKSVMGGNPSNVIWYIDGMGGTPTFYGNPTVYVDGAIKVENDGQIRSQLGTGPSADIRLTGHLYNGNPSERLFTNGDNSQFIFQGADDQLIDGGTATQNNFNKLRIFKTSSAGKVTLFNDISIRQNIELAQGDLNLQASEVYLTFLNTSNAPITLESSNLADFPKILNETENNRIYGSSIFTGVIVENQEIASPGNPFADGPLNLGNMGAEIYDPENHFGAAQITIKRLHRSTYLVVDSGDPMNPTYMLSIGRAYAIESTADIPIPSGMDFTFRYLDAEVYESEDNLTIFKSGDNGTTWNAQAADLNTTANTLVQNNVSDITNWWTAFPCVNAPNVSFPQSPETHLCDDTEHEITPYNTGGPAAAYEWILDGDTLGLNEDHFTITGIDGTPNQTLEFIAYDTLGCYDSETVTLVHEDSLTVDLEAETMSVCQHSITPLTQVSNYGTSFQWKVNGVSAGSGPTFNFYANAYGLGNHTVEVTASSPYCSATDEMIVTVVPTPFVSLPFQIRTCDAGTTDLTANPSGGTPPYDYNWNNSESTQTITVTNANTTFSVTLTDDNGCTSSAFMPMCYSNIVIDETHSDVSCFGEADGAIDLTISGTYETLQYNWSNSATTQDLTGLTAGTYTVTVTDASFGCSGDPYCEKTASITLTGPSAALSTSSIVTDILCHGNGNGAINLSVSGGTPGYTYLWSNGETTQDLSGLSGGTYTVTVTDANLCTTTSSIVVDEPEPLEPSSPPNVIPVHCHGESDGAIFWTITGGTDPYIFSWTGPNGYTSADEVLENLPAGTYNVTVTDANDCSYSASFDVTEPDPLATTLTPTNITCYGDTDGQIVLANPTGGTDPYFYEWEGPNGFTSTDQNIGSLEPGDYTVTVYDNNECMLVPPTVTIAAPSAPLSVTATVTDVTCFGEHNGTITTTVTGGWAPYSYSWLDPDDEDLPGTPNQSNLGPGAHELTLFDDNGCYLIEYFTVEEPDEIFLNETLTDISCHGGNDGSIFLNVTGGTGSFTYNWQWATGTSTASFIDNLAGPTQTYSVTATDANNCPKTGTFEIVEPTAITAASVVQHVSCHGYGDGSIDLSPAGGTGSLSFSWTGPNGFTATDEDLFDLAAGMYSVSITDANGCPPFTATYTINQPTQLTANPLVTIPLECFGDTDGQLNANPAGGTPPYTYLWTYPDFTTATTQFISNLSQTGTYSIDITDAQGCPNVPGQVMIELTSPPALTTSGVITDVGINGGSDGAIDFTVSGGTGSFSFLWSNGETTEDLTGLPTGTYQVTATDANNCPATASFFVDEPEVLTIAIEEISQVSCHGADDGYILTYGEGGVPPYFFIWSNGDTDGEITDLAPGDYSLTLTDDNGAEAIENFTITEPAPLADGAVLVMLSCFMENDGSISLNPTGGTPPFQYLWSNDETTSAITGLAAGDYLVTITDDRGCQFSNSYTITQPPLLLTGAAPTDANCYGANDGSIQMSPTGGTGPFSYNWDNGANTGSGSGTSIPDLFAGNYDLTVTDNNGCTAITIATVGQPPALGLTISGDDDICESESSLLDAGDFSSYDWSTSETTQTITVTTGGVYSVTVTNASGCTATDDFTLTVNPLPTIVVASSFCAPNLLTYTVEINTDGVQLLADFGTVTDHGGGSYTVSDIPAGQDVTITTVAASGNPPCENTLVVPAEQCPCPAVNAPVSGGNEAICEGEPIPDLTVTVGTDETADWYDAPSGGNLLLAANTIYTPTDAGTFYAETRNTVNACVSDTRTAITLTIHVLPSANAGTDVGICLSNSTTLDASGSSGSGTLSYLWSPTTGLSNPNIVNPVASPTATTTYAVQVTDANGCTDSDAVLVTVHPLPVANAGADATICAGSSTQLNATVNGNGGYSFLWSPTAGLSNPNIANPVANPLGTTTYTVLVTDGNGCTDTDPVTVTVNPVPMLALDTTLCSLDLLSYDVLAISNGNELEADYGTVTDHGNGTFTISGVPAGQNVTLTANFTATGCEKNLVVTAPLCPCPDVDPPTSNGDETICASDPIPALSVTVGTDETADWYDAPTDGNLLLAANTSYTPTTGGVFYAEARSTINQCLSDNRTAVALIVNPLPVALAGSDVAICLNASTQLDASGSSGSGTLTYLWSPATGLDNPNIANPVANPTVTTTYSVQVTDGNGCSASDEVKVTVNALPTLSVLDTICAPNLLTYKVLINTNGNSVTATLGTMINTGGGNFTVNGVPTGQNVTITSTVTATGCQASQTVDSPLCPCPFVGVPVSGGNPVICASSPIPALMVTVGANETADWYDAPTGGNLLLAANTSYTPTGAGTFYAEARNTINQCLSDTRTAITLTIHALPSANAGPDVPVCTGGSTQLDAGNSSGNAPLSYAWAPANTLNNPNIVNPIASPTSTTTYTVTVTDGNGCTATDQVKVTVNPKPSLNVVNTICALNLQTYKITVFTNGNTLTATLGTVTSSGGGYFTVSGITTGEDVTVTATFSATGCQTSLTAVSPDCPCPVVNAPVSGGNQAICAGNPIPTLTVTVGTNQTADWYDAPTGGNLLLAANTSYTPTGTGTFYAEARNTINDCVSDSRTAITLTIHALPTANAGADVTHCLGSSSTLDASGSSGNGTLSYLWSPATGLNNPNIVNPVANPTVTTTYTVQVTDGNGCTDTDQVTVTVNQLPYIFTGAFTCSFDLMSYDIAVASNADEISSDFGTVVDNGNGSFSIIDIAAGQNIVITATNSTTGCQQTLNVNAPDCNCPNVEAPTSNGDASICLGDPIPALSVTVGTDETADWYDAPTGGTLLLAGNTSYTPTTAGTFYAEARNTVNDCVSNVRTAITLTVNDLPSANAGTDAAICAGSSTTLNAGASTGAGILSYAWTPTTGLSNPNIVNPVASPVTTTTYAVQVTDENGCTASDAVVVSVNVLPAANAGSDAAICLGNSTQLNASSNGPATYAWSPASGLSATDISNPIANPAATTTYSVLITDGNGCTASDQVTVAVNDLPIAEAGPFAEICFGSSTQLNASSSSGNAPLSYAWSPGTGLSATNIPNPTANPVATTTYEVQVTDGNGCTSTDQVTVFVNALPLADAGADATICLEGTTTLDASNSSGSGTLSYAWSPATGLSATDIPNPVAEPDVTTTYEVEVTDGNGCTQTDQVTVFVNPLPTLTIDSTVCALNLFTYTVYLTTDALDVTASAGYVTNYGGGHFTVSEVPSGNEVIVTATDLTTGCDNSEVVPAPICTCPVVPPPISGGDKSICNGSPIPALTVTVGSDETASWYSAPVGGVLLLANSTSYTPTGPGTFYAQARNTVNNCISSTRTPVSLSINSVPSANAGPNVAICASNSTQLDASGSSGTAPLSYAWSPASSLNNPNIVNPIASPLTSTTYTVTVTNGNGCTATDQVSVTVNPLPVITVNNVICDAGLSTYHVLITTNANTVTASEGTVTNLGSGMFQIDGVTTGNDLTLTATLSGTGCAKTQGINSPNCNCPPVNPPVSGGDQTICESEPIPALIVTVGTGETANWYDAPTGGNLLLAGSTSYTPAGAGIFYVEAENTTSGCASTVRTLISLTINLLPTANAGADVSICESDNTQLDASGSSGNGGLAFAWSPATGLSNPDIVNPLASPTATTTYSVLVTDGAGCSASDEVTVTVEPVPTLAIDLISCAVDLQTYTVEITSDADGLTASAGTVTDNGNGTFSISDIPAGQDVVLTASFTTSGCLLSQTVTAPDCSCPVVETPLSNGDQELCEGEIFHVLTVLVNAGETADWYDAPTGGNLLLAGNNEYLPTGPGVFYAQARIIDNGCISSSRVALTVTVLPAPAVSFDDPTDVCAGSPPLTLTGSPVGGTFDGPGVAGDQFDPVAAGPGVHLLTYSFTDTNGCEGVAEQEIEVFDLPQVLAEANSPVCDGGDLQLTESGGEAVEWDWTGPNGFVSTEQNPVVPALPSAGTGIYEVTILSAEGCANTGTVSVVLNPPLELSLSPDPAAFCPGGNVQLTASASGGDESFSYAWTTPSAGTGGSPVIVADEVGSYAVTVTDGSGCTITGSLEVSELPAMAVAFTSTDASCNSSDGSLTANATGGQMPYTFAWDGLPNTTNQLTNVPAGNYQVIVTDGAGCSFSAIGTVGNTGAPVVTLLGSEDATCAGAATGSITIDVSGGVMPFDFNWSNGEMTQNLSGLTAGNYGLEIVDALGCLVTATYQIDEPTAIVGTLVMTETSSPTASNGAIDLTVTGGVPSYSFAWSNGLFSEDISNLFIGPYSVTITDANGCTLVENTTVTSVGALATNLAGQNISCNGLGDGSVEAVITGGVMPYSILWSTGSTQPIIDNLPPGTYSVTVTDQDGTTSTASIVLTQAPVLQAFTQKTDNQCNGASAGTANVLPSGGATPYTYAWSDGQTTEMAIGLPAGVFTVTVTDGNGCTIEKTATIGEPPAMLIAVNAVTDIACFGGIEGAIDIGVSGGAFPYTASWSNGGTTQDISGLTAGTYVVTITDFENCTATATVEVEESPQIVIAFDVTDVICFGEANGSLTANVSGGTPGSTGYQFEWENGETTATIENLVSGNYFLTVTDELGCTSFDVDFVAQPDELLGNLTFANISCYGLSNGSALVLPMGGTIPYSYLWNTGVTDSFLEDLDVGDYSLVITDGAGCTTVESLQITEPDTLVATYAVTDLNCLGDFSGAIDLEIVGGSPLPSGGYDITWDSGQFSEDIDQLEAGDYIVNIIDENGCNIQDTIAVGQPDAIIADADLTNVSCYGGNDGSIALTVSGGNAPYLFAWQNGTTAAQNTGLAIGNYTCTVTDDHGCTVTLENELTQPDFMTIETQIQRAGCKTNSDGWIDLTVEGGALGYTFLWSTGAGTEDIYQLPVGSYSVTVTDGNGCTSTRSLGVASSGGTFEAHFLAASGLFDVDSVEVTSEDIIQFVDVSLPAPNAWEWHFGDPDSTTSELPNPAFSYPNDETAEQTSYMATLVASNLHCRDTTTKQIWITNNFRINAPQQDSLAYLTFTDVLAYPNPTMGMVTLEIELSREETVRLYVVDVLGKILQHEELEGSDHYETKLDLSDLLPGIYFINLRSVNQVHTVKVVVTDE